MPTENLRLQYDLVECSPEIAQLLATVFFRLSDAGGYANLDSESLEALGKVLTALVAKCQSSR